MNQQINFNNKWNPEWVLVHEITDRLMPLMEVHALNIRGRSGQHRVGKDIGIREITVTFTIEAESITQMKARARQLANNWLWSKEPARLFTSEEPEVFYMAEVSGGGEIREDTKLGRCQITFQCLDPFAYKNEATVIEHSTVPADSLIRIDIDGHEVFPMIEMRFTQNTNRFALIRANQHLEFKAPTGNVFNQGDILIINNETGQVLLNGERYFTFLTPDSTFLSLDKGTNYLFVDGRHLVSNLRIAYRERLL